ncbi:hypothetical protein ACNKHQ_22035 [Shigella flexneri]
MENARIVGPGYAIEYDFFKSTRPETHAGKQIYPRSVLCGTNRRAAVPGYEAAAQGHAGCWA